MKRMTLEAAVTEAFIEERERDPQVIIMGENSTTGAGVMNHAAYDQKFPDSVVNMPVNEALISVSAVGMALAGMKPIAEFDFQDFMSLGFDGIVNEAAKVRFWSRGKVSLPIVYLAAGGMMAGLGCNHTQQVEAWFANVPGVKICIPTTAADSKGLMKTAIRDTDPVIFLMNRSLCYVEDNVPEGEYTVPMGKARIAKEGTDVTVVCWHAAYVYTMQLVEELEKDGISVEVIDPLTLNPLDVDTIVKSVKKTGRLIVSHEAPYKFGAGTEIVAQVAEKCRESLKADPRRVCSPRTAVPSGESEFRALLKRSDIAKAIFEMMGKEMPEKDIYTAPTSSMDFFNFTGSEVYDPKNPAGREDAAIKTTLGENGMSIMA